MSLLLLAQADVDAPTWIERLESFCLSDFGRIICSVVLLGLGLVCLLPPQGRGRTFAVGVALVVAGGLGLLLPTVVGTSPAVAFFALEALVVLGAVGTISSRSPLYSAIWFAVTLLGVGAVLLLNGAQFLGIATVAVYAGAIVVTFLFVLMLSQPEGHSFYDRMGWGSFPMACAVVAGTTLVGLIAWQITTHLQSNNGLRVEIEKAVQAFDWSDDSLVAGSLRADVRGAAIVTEKSGVKLLTVDLAGIQPGSLDRHHAELAGQIRRSLGSLLPATCRIEVRRRDVLDANHVAYLGRELFGRQLISVEIGGVLLLVALVGAFAMASSGPDRRRSAVAKG